MTDEFWIYRPSILWKEYLDFYPTKEHDGYRFYNAVSRLLILVMFTFILFQMDISFVLFVFIFVNMLGYMYKSREVPIKCREPTINNPMMNALLTEGDLGLQACKDRDTDESLLYGVREDSGVLFRNKLVKRAFVTLPVTRYPNDAGEFSSKVYGQTISGCKTMGRDCKTYRDIRFYR